MADNQNKAQRPSEAMTHDQVKVISNVKFENRIEGLGEDLIIRESDQWKWLRDHWANSSPEKRKDLVYGLVYHNGAKPKDIQRLFNIQKKELDPYTDVINQAIATLKLKI